MFIIDALFHDDTLTPMEFEPTMICMGRVIDSIAMYDKRFDKNNWCLQTRSDAEATLYRAFDNGAPSTAALAVLKEKFRKSPELTYVGLWDGHENVSSNISMACFVGPKGERRSFSIEMAEWPKMQEVSALLAVVSCIARELRPAYIQLAPSGYALKQVFDDKPGVGWMLYLPTVLSARQVPEAGALIPVPEKGRKQTGTIIVSVADDVFSMDNPQHVELANRIEIRLVDQDLLPRYLNI